MKSSKGACGVSVRKPLLSTLSATHPILTNISMGWEGRNHGEGKTEKLSERHNPCHFIRTSTSGPVKRASRMAWYRSSIVAFALNGKCIDRRLSSKQLTSLSVASFRKLQAVDAQRLKSMDLARSCTLRV